MFIGLILFLIVIASTPLDFFWSQPWLLGLRLLAVGAGLILVAISLSPRERIFMQAVTRYAIFCFALVLIWVLLQVLPLGPVAHPFWESAAAALNRPVADTISIDIGATLLAFTQTSLALGILLLGAALTIDRTRAEWILIALTVVAGLLLESLLFGIVVPAWVGMAMQEDLGRDIFTFASFALVLAATTANFAYERFETRRSHQDRPFLKLLLQESGCAFAFIVAVLVLLQSPDRAVLVTAFSGVCVLLFLIVVRRLTISPLVGGAIAFVLLIACVISAGTAHVRSNELLLAYSTASDNVLELTQRMMFDAPWIGTGAGTFESLRPLYQSFMEPKDAQLASTAAILTIELGRIGFWLIVAMALLLFIRLLRGALLRGRDSFYPAAGAACLCTILLAAFVNAGLFAAPNYLFASAILGMALAQSVSRTS